MDGMGDERRPLTEDEFREALDLLRPVAELGAAPQRANAIVALGVLRERAPGPEAASEAVRALLRAAVAPPREDGEAGGAEAPLAAARAEAARFADGDRRFARAEAMRLSDQGGPRIDRSAAARLAVDLAGEGGRGAEAGALARWWGGTALAARRFAAGWRAWYVPLGVAAALSAVLPLALAARLLSDLPGHAFTLAPDLIAALGTAAMAALATGLVAAPGALVGGPLARAAEAAKVGLAVGLGTLLLGEAGRATLMAEYDVSRAEALALLLPLVPAVAAARLAALPLPARRSLPATAAEHALTAGGFGALAAVALALLLAAFGAGGASSGAIAGAEGGARDLAVPGLPILSLLAIVAAFASAAGSGWTSFWSGGGGAAGGRGLRLARAGLLLATPLAVAAVFLMAGAVPRDAASAGGGASVAASGMLRPGPDAPDCAAAVPETRAADIGLGEYRRLPLCAGQPASLVTGSAGYGPGFDLELFVVNGLRRRVLRQDDPDPPRLEASARDLQAGGGPLFFCLQRYGTDRCVPADRPPARVWSAAAAYNAMVAHAARRGLVVTAEQLAALPGSAQAAAPDGEAGFAVTIRFGDPAAARAAPDAPAAAAPGPERRPP